MEMGLQVVMKWHRILAMLRSAGMEIIKGGHWC